MIANTDILRQRAHALKPTAWIGKNGTTPEAVGQIAMLLKKHRLVKVKLLRSFLETNSRQEAAGRLAELTASEVIDSTGFTIVLWKKTSPDTQ